MAAGLVTMSALAGPYRSWIEGPNRRVDSRRKAPGRRSSCHACPSSGRLGGLGGTGVVRLTPRAPGGAAIRPWADSRFGRAERRAELRARFLGANEPVAGRIRNHVRVERKRQTHGGADRAMARNGRPGRLRMRRGDPRHFSVSSASRGRSRSRRRGCIARRGGRSSSRARSRQRHRRRALRPCRRGQTRTGVSARSRRAWMPSTSPYRSDRIPRPG